MKNPISFHKKRFFPTKICKYAFFVVTLLRKSETGHNMERHLPNLHTHRRLLLIAAIALLGLSDAMPAYSQNNNEIRSGRIGIEFGKTRTGRKGSQYKSRRNNIMENNSKMGFWSVGVIGGGNYNWQTRDAGYAYDMSFSGRFGGYAGVSATYMFFDWLSIRADILYSQKNFGMRRMQPTLRDMDIHTNYTNHYLQVPVMADWTFGSLVRAHILTGAYGGVWVGGNTERMTVLNTESVRSAYKFSKEDNLADAGLVGGVGVSWDPLQYLRIGAEVMFYYSMTNTMRRQAVMTDRRYNNTVVFGLSARYVF